MSGAASLNLGCIVADCQQPTWSAAPLCAEHLVEAVSTILPKPDRERFWAGLDDVLKTFTYKEREILKLTYGFADGYVYTDEEVARIFKETPGNIRAILADLTAKLKEQPRLGRVNELFLSLFKPHDFGVLGLSAPTVLVQSVVVPGPRYKDGDLIEAVAIPWHMILRMIEKDPRVVHQISPRKWEELVAGWYTAAGFDEVILTPHSRDKGRDVIAVKRDILTIKVIDQVKAYGPGNVVPANDVRALLGVLQADRSATKGVVTTTSTFAPEMREDEFIAPFIPYRLELIEGASLLDRLKQVADKSR